MAIKTDVVNTGDYIDDPNSDDAYTAFSNINEAFKSIVPETGLPIVDGGTGATTIAAARANLGLEKFAQNPGLNTVMAAPSVDAAIVISDTEWGVYNGGVPGFSAALQINNGGTGATTVEQAKINLGLAAIRLPAGTNLNDVKTPGTYYCDTDAAAQSMLNLPLGNSFSLKVDIAAGVIQEVTFYAASGTRQFIRGFYQEWYAWEEVVKGNKRLRTDSGQTGITAPNTEAGIYITDTGYPFLFRGTASTAPRWSVDAGGTGGTTAAEARANLGLGSAATRNIGLGLGDIATNDSARRAFGSIPTGNVLPNGWDLNNLSQGDYVFYDAGVGYLPNAPSMPYCSLYVFRNFSNSDQLTVVGHDYFTGGVITRGKQNQGWSTWAKHYHTLNTTINGNGYIVPSSPTVKIHPDSFELNEDSIKLGAVCEKLGVGHYEISNVDGFHQEGWYFDIPTDRYKNPLIAADYEYLPDARKIVIKAYAVKANTFPFEPDLDTPMDAPQGRWIDVRLYEPEWLNKTELPKPEEPIVDDEGNTAPSRLHELVDGVWVISDENAAILEQERLAAMPALKRRQFRLTLAMNGYDLKEIESLIDQIEDPMQRTIAQIEWQDATDFERTNPTLLMMAQLLGLSSEDVDSLWEYGLAL